MAEQFQCHIKTPCNGLFLHSWSSLYVHWDIGQSNDRSAFCFSWWSLLECVENESQGKESQGWTDNYDFVRWVHLHVVTPSICAAWFISHWVSVSGKSEQSISPRTRWGGSMSQNSSATVWWRPYIKTICARAISAFLAVARTVLDRSHSYIYWIKLINSLWFVSTRNKS